MLKAAQSVGLVDGGMMHSINSVLAKLVTQIEVEVYGYYERERASVVSFAFLALW